jgi:hypothetical protein
VPFAYKDVDEGGEHDGAVAAEPRVRDRPAQQRQQLRRAVPGVEGRRRRRDALAQRPRQVGDQVRRHAVEGEALRDLHRCTRASSARAIRTHVKKPILWSCAREVCGGYRTCL